MNADEELIYLRPPAFICGFNFFFLCVLGVLGGSILLRLSRQRCTLTIH